ncbi:MAG: ATP-binding cassette domain-containing protein, partial [Arenicellales bacterium]|nr:ATP-binding cassette domain-containing protein [Arenicellales bacterium]
MPLLRANDLHHAFGDHALLVGVNLTIEQGECTCLVGRNGCGKSTLLKILAQQITPDDGTIEYSDNLKLTSLEQEIPSDLNDSVYDVIAGGLGPIGKLLSRY